MPGVIAPATGPFVSAIETAANRKAEIVGKPNTFAFEILKKMLPEMTEDSTLMIGDRYSYHQRKASRIFLDQFFRADSDVQFGKNCKIKTLMVGSGGYSEQDLQKWMAEEKFQFVPDFYAQSLGALNNLME